MKPLSKLEHGYKNAVKGTKNAQTRSYPNYPEWPDILQNFSGRQITYARDRLPAIAAIASEFQKITGDRYFTGIWESHVIEDLMWVSASPESSRHSPGLPSWTWASLEGPVSLSRKARFEGVGWPIQGSKYESRATIDEGTIWLQGRIKQAFCRPGQKKIVSKASESNKITAFRSDTLSSRADGLTNMTNDLETIWCLAMLEGKSDDPFKMMGLVLSRARNGRFQRVGVAGFLTSNWFDDADVSTVAIC
jgi:hypothetical protein